MNIFCRKRCRRRLWPRVDRPPSSPRMSPIEPAFSHRIPEGDGLPRKVCDHCGFVAYENPKIVVGSVVRHEGRFLLFGGRSSRVAASGPFPPATWS